MVIIVSAEVLIREAFNQKKQKQNRKKMNVRDTANFLWCVVQVLIYLQKTELYWGVVGGILYHYYLYM